MVMTVRSQAVQPHKSAPRSPARPPNSGSPPNLTGTTRPFILPPPLSPPSSSAAMEAIRLQKKYPDVSRDEMFDLINRFKCVFVYIGCRSYLLMHEVCCRARYVCLARSGQTRLGE